jgi:long-subunit fatty acid transport protein
MIWIALLSTAFGSSTAGMGLSPMGGGLSGVTEPGVLGLATTPAAALSKRSEAVIDLAANFYSATSKLDGRDPEEISGVVPMPFLGATLPMGRWGLGAYGMIPYGGGASLPEDGAQRFHIIDAESFLMEGGLSLGHRLTETITVGASFRVGRATLFKNTAMNTAALINSKTDLNPPLPTDNPLFHGSQVLDLSGIGFAYGLGMSVTLPKDLEAHLSYRSPMRVKVSGPVDISPTDDLDLTLSGDATGHLTYAQEIELGLVIPVGTTRIALTGGWTDWSGMAEVDVSVRNLSIDSDNGALQSFIMSSGVNEADILAAGTDIHNDLGNDDAFHGGIAVDFPVSKFRFRPGVFYAGTTISDETFHAGVADFPALDLRISASALPVDWLTVALTVDHFVIVDRTVQTSGLSLDNDASTGRVLPSANGQYGMNATRTGLTLIARH